MLSYCNGVIMVISNCVVCGSKKAKFIKPNKAGLFECSFFWGGKGSQFDPHPPHTTPSCFKKK